MCPIMKYFTAHEHDVMLKRYCQGEFGKCYRFQRRAQGLTVPEHAMPWDGMTEFGV